MEKVSDFVSSNFKASSIFKKYKIDFCCNGSLLLKDVCEKKNINYDKLLNELAELDKTDSNDIIGYLDIKGLVNLIIEKHHKYLKETLPVIEQFAKKVSQVHGERRPELVELYNVFIDMKKSIERHLEEEENNFFIKISNWENIDEKELRTLLTEIEEDHQDLGKMLLKIRELTNDFISPSDACNTYKVLFQYLEDMESDLHMHIHLENNVLHSKLRLELTKV
jgi:regulator of cell morphogenesis and NO signaling